MNFIKSIRASGLKSGDFIHALERVNLFVGRSASGKTARIDALRLALNGGTLLGRASDLKSRTMDIMDLARNGHIEVEAIDNTGRRVARRWVRGKNCIVLADELPPTPDILMDSGLYTSLSEAKKIEYAFSLAKIDAQEFTHGAIVAEVKNIRLEENNATTESILNEILAYAGSGRTLVNQSVQDWLANLLTIFKRRLSDAEAEARRMTSVVQGITQLTNGAMVRNPEAELKAERNKATRILSERQNLEQQLTALRDILARRRVIQEEILGLQDKPESIAETQAKITELEAEITRIEAAPLTLPSEFTGLDEQAIRTEMESLSAEVQAHKSPLEKMRNDRLTLGGKINSLEREIELFEQATKETAAMYERALALSCCPSCGAEPEHWKGDFSKEALRGKRAAEMLHRKATLERKQDALAILKSDLERAEKEITAQQAIDLKIEEKRLRSNQLFATLRNVASAQDKARIERDGAARTKRFHMSQHREYLAGLQELGTKRKEAEARLMELSLDGKPSEAAITTQIAQKTAELTDCETTFAELEKQRTAFIQAQTDERRNAQALVEHQRAKVNVEVTKAAIAKLERIQADMVTRAFESILKTVNAITQGIVDAPIEYRDGEIGRWSGASWIKHESFSGTEKALVYSGLSLALAKDAPVRIVLVDELGRLDPQSLGRFIARMVQLVEDGVCDQFCGCYSGTLIGMEGVNIIQL